MDVVTDRHTEAAEAGAARSPASQAASEARPVGIVTIDDVGAASAVELVRSGPADEDVIAAVAVDGVVPAAAQQSVLNVAAIEFVVADPAVEPVDTFVAVEAVPALRRRPARPAALPPKS